MVFYAVHSAPCLGIDLAGVDRNETGIALLVQGHLAMLGSAYTDSEIIAHVEAAGPTVLSSHI
ncbi:MAG: hypothetical protein M0Z94_18550 [Dehalococcoidales bacterium]|nr:hypothetical protein [Dehalococcoidales bacterium]